MKTMGKVVAAAMLAGLAGAASAEVIDNGEFGANIGSIGGAFGSDVYGQSFIAPAENVVVKFGMWLSGGGNVPPAVRVDLWADDGSNNPDENNILVEGTTHQGALNTLTRIDSTTSFALTPGERYWVVLNGIIDQTSDGSYSSTWDGGTNTIPDGNMTWSNDLGGSWSGGFANGDFGVYVETIPTPGSLALLGLGGLAACRRRR